MANDDTPSIIASWPPEGLTLELAVERTIGSLTPLYAAAAAYRDIGIIGSGFRARHPQNNSGDLPLYFEDKLRAEIILERVQNEIFSPFRTLLTTGELVVAIRPISDLGAPLQLLRTDETSQLTIKMHHSQNSLTLCGPDAKELYGLFWPKDIAHMIPRRSALRVEIAAFPSQPAAGATQSEAAPQIDTIQSNKGWFEWAVRNVPPDDFKHGSKKRYAKKLEGILAQDAKKNEKLKPSRWTSIYTRLTEQNLWPKPQTHEKTTK
jgi:hypothetical protein